VQGEKAYLSIGLCNLSNALRLSGVLYDAEAAARRALILDREIQSEFDEAVSLQWLGLTLAARRVADDAVRAIRRATGIFRRQNHQQGVGVNYAYLAQAYLWRGDAGGARILADHAWDIASKRKNPRDFIRAARLQGAAAVGELKPSPPTPLPNGEYAWERGDAAPDESSDTPSPPSRSETTADGVSQRDVWERGMGGEGVAGDEGLSAYADERLHFAITKGREINFAEEELPALVALALLRRLQGRHEEARERLGEVWEGAERGPYPMFHADALNVLAQIERDAGNTDAAIAAATKAYTLAWCDGISADGSVCYAYAYGLRKARAHLEALGAPIPSLPPFSFDGREPMPEVEIDPDDEWHVGDRRVEEEL
jgi:tetratricopeptide (TPR) repeat protein